jgi:RNA polymerase sigma factor (sigma-70 family)
MDGSRRRDVTVSESRVLTERFEENRTHLQAVAFRMLGSLSEADDAVQETWLRVTRSDTSEVENLSGWLTAVVARVCLDILRRRRSRFEEPLGALGPAAVNRENRSDPEREVLMADSIGLALLVVLETLAPVERLAFVLHDLFALPFEEIAPIVGRSPTAARQLASRARRRVQGADKVPDVDRTRQREIVEAFLVAIRGGDLGALLTILDPDVVLRADAGASPSGAPREIRGARAVIDGQLALRATRTGATSARAVLVNGAVGVVVAPRGRLFGVIGLTIARGRITEIDLIADAARLRQLDLAVLDG